MNPNQKPTSAKNYAKRAVGFTQVTSSQWLCRSGLQIWPWIKAKPWKPIFRSVGTICGFVSENVSETNLQPCISQFQVCLVRNSIHPSTSTKTIRQSSWRFLTQGLVPNKNRVVCPSAEVTLAWTTPEPFARHKDKMQHNSPQFLQMFVENVSLCVCLSHKWFHFASQKPGSCMPTAMELPGCLPKPRLACKKTPSPQHFWITIAAGYWQFSPKRHWTPKQKKMPSKSTPLGHQPYL